MSFTFPSDSAGKAGAVHSTNAGTDFYVPVRQMGFESISGNILTVPSGGAVVQFPNIPCNKLLIIGLRNNTGSIYVGGNAVSSSSYGAELLARDSLQLEIANANLVYVTSSVNGEGVSYFAI